LSISGTAWLFLATMALNLACSPDTSNGVTAMVVVEMDVFSGRPNPTWDLAGSQLLELQEALQGLPPINDPLAEGGLGYRGFVLLNPDRLAGLPPQIRICGGIVTMTDGQARSFYQDVHGVEHRLLQLASLHGYKDITDSVLPGILTP
jgi:hypothetical protein